MIDKMWLECYNSIIKEKIETPWKEYVLYKDMADKITEKANNFACAVSAEDIKSGLENTANALKWYSLYGAETMCNAVVKLEGDNNEQITIN